MNTYKQIKNRLTKEEQEGLNNLLAKLRAKREEAAGVNEPGTLLVQQEVRDDEGHRTVQEELDLNG